MGGSSSWCAAAKSAQTQTEGVLTHLGTSGGSEAGARSNAAIPNGSRGAAMKDAGDCLRSNCVVNRWRACIAQETLVPG